MFLHQGEYYGGMKMQDKLLKKLVERGLLADPVQYRAFKEIKRSDFVPAAAQESAWADYPLPIGFGQTISQPYTVAFMFRLLDPKPGNSILDIGSGSGWTTALLASITGSAGSVLGLERIPELVDFGSSNLEPYAFPHARIEQAGPELGTPRCRYDRILISAAAKELPAGLVAQLHIGGTVVIPVENSIIKLVRSSESTRWQECRIERHYGFVFVPLIGGER